MGGINGGTTSFYNNSNNQELLITKSFYLESGSLGLIL